MRLHTALEHLKSGHYRSMEPWKANEIDEMARHVEACAASAAEFTFSFLDADPKDDTLQTFIDFANELWDAEVAPIPHDVFGSRGCRRCSMSTSIWRLSARKI